MEEMPQPRPKYILVYLLLGAILCISIGLFFGYVFFGYNPHAYQTAQLAALSPTATPSPTVPPFLKRQIDVTKPFYQQTPYPAEIVNGAESTLVGMKCSQRIECGPQQTGCQYTSPNQSSGNSSNPVTDTRLLTAIKSADTTKDASTSAGLPMKEVSSATFCDIEDNRTIIEYKTGGGGGGSGSRDYIGLVDQAGTVKRIGSIEENSPYFGCTQPIQLTKNNNLFYRCDGGDGPAGSHSVYRINLIANTVNRVLNCSNHLDANNQPIQTCQ